VLARQQLLLVLDNCEHLIGAAAELCAGLLLACDDVRVLATSREPLAVAGEARYRLAPLSLPDGDGEGDAGGSEAVALFADRARRVDARFVLDRERGPTVGRLVARLDGMPLAIELAAARVEALGVSGLLDRLDDRFALLAGGDRLAVARQRSLAATVEWSYQLLDEHERRVFRQVSVFPGPFTLEAAEAVAGADAGPAVLHLVDCSLLSPPQAGPGPAGGRAGLVVAGAGPLAGPVPAAARGGRVCRGGQRRLVHPAVLVLSGRGVLRGYGRGAGCLHRAAGRGRGRGAVPGAGRWPGWAGEGTGEHGVAAPRLAETRPGPAGL